MTCYRQRFRAASRKEGETNGGLSARLQDLSDKWTQGCNTKEELKDDDCVGKVGKYTP